MLDTQSGHHFMCGVCRIRVEHAFWTAYVSNVTAIGDTNDTILGLDTIYRDFILFEWDLKPYDRKINLYKRILFVLRVSSYFGRFLTNCAFTAPFLGRYYGYVSYLPEILSDNDTRASHHAKQTYVAICCHTHSGTPP